ncbi:hypothetical protein GmHk_03G008960 [Glycine max]|nr:hypothetical protein GmHk_03G008960 [Glycine max]
MPCKAREQAPTQQQEQEEEPVFVGLFQLPLMDRSGQIPAFGNWDYANELPITQYFESARQAGLVRYSSSSGESDPYVRADRDLYAVDFKKPIRNIPPSTLKKATRNRVVKEREKENVKMNMRKQGKVCDVTEQARKPVAAMHLDDAVPRLPKPVDEDLYKIPPELLGTTKRVGFLTKHFPFLF